MPWCPKCKNEYRAGIEVCADCNVPLVADLNAPENIEATTLLVQMDASKIEFAEKLIAYLAYSSVHAVSSVDETENILSIFVAEKDVTQAKRCFQAFYTVEAEQEMENAAKKAAGELVEEEEETEHYIQKEKKPVNAGVYVKKEERYNDYKSSAGMFLGFGIIGLVFVVLNLIDVLKLLTVSFSLLVMTAMFVAFIVIGILSYKKAGSIKEEAAQETEVIKELTRWLENAVTREELEVCEQDADGAELAYLKKIELLRNTLAQAFPEIDDSFLDQFVEDFYNSHFEQ